MPNRTQRETDPDAQAMSRVATSGSTPRDPETGEVPTNSDALAANRRALPVEGAEDGPVQPAEDIGTVRMVKDGNELDVGLRDIEAHRKMGWGFAR
jgi:hypothetical protein